MMEHTLKGEEIQDLAVSIFGLAAAFTILFFGGGQVADFILSPQIIPALMVSVILVAVSFIPHTMAHRVTARSMDTYAEYKMWTPGIALAVLSSLFGFVFAAPGGVRTYFKGSERYGLSVPEITTKMLAYIAIVGPLINISLAVLFAFLSMSVQGVTLYGVDLFLMGARVNGYIALFSLVPVHPMDGYKILRWRSGLWILTVFLAILTFFIG